MANCKFCGKPVRCATVYHAACWEQEVGRTAEEFCKTRCKYGETEEEEQCDSCPLLKLLNLGL